MAFLAAGLAKGAIAAASGLLLTLVALGPTSTLQLGQRLLAPLAAGILFTCAWLVFQIVPLPFESLANSIWPLASEALTIKAAGHISIDPVRTAFDLVYYFALLALVTSVAIVTTDRHRAKIVLFGLVVVASVCSLAALLHRYWPFSATAHQPPASPPPPTVLTMSACGILFAVAIAKLIREQGANSRSNLVIGSPVVGYGLCLLIALVASFAMMQGPVANAAIAAIAVSFLLLLLVARRLKIRPWPAACLATAFIACASFIALSKFQKGTGLTGWIVDSNQQSTAILTQLLAATPALGNGAGSFDRLIQLYSAFDSPKALPVSSAVVIMTEWGPWAFWIVVAWMVQLIGLLTFAAMSRGRDASLPAVAAAVVIAAGLQSFLDEALLSPVTHVPIAIVVGLGLGQRIGTRDLQGP